MVLSSETHIGRTFMLCFILDVGNLSVVLLLMTIYDYVQDAALGRANKVSLCRQVVVTITMPMKGHGC